MQRINVKLTVLFEDPFWIGVFERITDGKLTVCKVTFGSEPKDYEVKEFLMENHDRLSFSPEMAAEVQTEKRNPKRMQREIQKQVQETGIGTKSQQALKLHQEQKRAERKAECREQKEHRKEQQFTLRQQKKKEKHRGR